MKKLLLAALLGSAAMNASAVTYDFDYEGEWDYFGYHIPRQMAQLYFWNDLTPGITFYNFFIIRPKQTTYFNPYLNHIVSGDKVAYTPYLSPWGQSRTDIFIFSNSGDSFQFNSLWMGANWFNDLHVEIIGLEDGIVKYSKTVILNTTSTDFVQLNWIVDKVSFEVSGGEQIDTPWHADYGFTIDDVNINFTPVPEPSTFAMLGLGLGFLSLASRRRNAN